MYTGRAPYCNSTPKGSSPDLRTKPGTLLLRGDRTHHWAKLVWMCVCEWDKCSSLGRWATSAPSGVGYFTAWRVMQYSLVSVQCRLEYTAISDPVLRKIYQVIHELKEGILKICIYFKVSSTFLYLKKKKTRMTNPLSWNWSVFICSLCCLYIKLFQIN